MFDKRLRPSVEQRLHPVGANLERSGITADHLTLVGVVMAVSAAVAIANGALRLGFVLLLLTAVPDVLDGAVAKASGTAYAAGRLLRLGRGPGERRAVARRRGLVHREPPSRPHRDPADGGARHDDAHLV